jgi:hypothetical protein
VKKVKNEILTCQDYGRERDSIKVKREVVLLSKQKDHPPVQYQESRFGTIGSGSANGGATKMFYVQGPSWLRKTWEVQFHRAITGWQIHPRVYCVRSDDSEIFKAVRRGNVPEMLQLIGTGQASLFDRGQDGGSLLYVRSFTLSRLFPEKSPPSQKGSSASLSEAS